MRGCIKRIAVLPFGNLWLKKNKWEPYTNLSGLQLKSFSNTKIHTNLWAITQISFSWNDLFFLYKHLYKHLNTTRKKKCCIYLHCLRRCVHAAVICLSQTCECTSLTACRSQLNKNCSWRQGVTNRLTNQECCYVLYLFKNNAKIYLIPFFSM